MEPQEEVYGYVRVSTKDQSNSLIVQPERIKRYCEFMNLKLKGIYIDENVSGFTAMDKRPEGSKLLHLLQSGKIKTIVVVKPDRLFRNVEDALITTNAWNDQGVALHIIDMGGASFTTKTANGRLIFTVLISIAQFERDHTAERTIAVLSNKKENGKVYANQVLGFDKTPDGNLIPNLLEMETVNKIFELSANKKPNAIAKILNDSHYKTKTGKDFFPSTVQYILKNPIYKQK